MSEATALSGYVWLNGRIVLARRARISVFDRGFLYGDGLFETVRCYRGNPFLLDEHMRRMHRSAAFLGLPVPEVNWPGVIEKLLAANSLLDNDASVRITVTRGQAPPGLLPPRAVRPTAFAFALPVPGSLAEDQKRGVKVMTVPFARSGFLAVHKLLDYVPAILARTIAAKQKAKEALYLHGGWILEATTANVFAVFDGTVVTPPTDELLPGITRALVISLAQKAGFTVAERPIAVNDLPKAQEVFLTSAVVEVLPVIQVGETTIAGGSPGPVTTRLQLEYRQRVSQLFAAEGRK